MFPTNALPLLAATSAAKTEDGGPKHGVPEFPGEQPSDKQLADWLDQSLPIFRQVFGAVMRGDTPAQFIELMHGPDDLTGHGSHSESDHCPPSLGGGQRPTLNH